MNSSGSENLTASWSAEQDDVDHEVTATKVAFALVEFLIGTLIICTNSLIVYAICTRAYLKNNTNKFVLHLAIADGCTGVLMIYYALLDVFPDLGKSLGNHTDGVNDTLMRWFLYRRMHDH